MPKLFVERSILVLTPCGKAYATVRDFRQWPRWSPWLICDPDCKLEFAPDGRSYSWDGKIIGAGTMAVTNEHEGESIDYQLNFQRPFKSEARVQFSFADLGGETRVKWTMHGSLPFFLFFLKNMMQGLVGMDYERGLLMLKDYAEAGTVPSKLDVRGEESVDGFSFVGIRNQCAIADIGPTMEQDFADLESKTRDAAIQPTGKPFSIYHDWSPAKGLVDYTIGFPVDEAPVTPPLGIVGGSLPGCRVFSIQHTGPYRHLGNAWSAGYARKQAKVFAMAKSPSPFETYENDPRETPEDELISTVHFPLK